MINSESARVISVHGKGDKRLAARIVIFLSDRFISPSVAISESVRYTLIALAAMIPLELIIAGEGADIDLMWIVVIGVGATSYAIRYNSERVWWRDLERKAKMIAGSREGG